MKRMAAILIATVFASGAFAQGLVNFINTPTTLYSSGVVGGPPVTSIGAWYFGLLIGTGFNPNTFTFTGLYATNLAPAGRFYGGFNIAVPGWAAGVTTNYAVAIWSSSLGHNFNPAWLAGDFSGQFGDFGFSPAATGVAGGLGSPATPAYNLFGGATGIQTGFNAYAVGPLTIPEPGSISLAALGFAVMLLRRRLRRAGPARVQRSVVKSRPKAYLAQQHASMPRLIVLALRGPVVNDDYFSPQ